MRKLLQQRMFKAIRRWQRSGLTQKDWCENNDIAYRKFHYWYRRYRIGEQGHARDQENDRFVPLVVGPSAAAGSWCELSFPEGKRLAFHQPVSAEFLRSLIG